MKMRWSFFIVTILLFNACHFFEEEPKVLLSKIDGEDYTNLIEGEMNAKKAYIFIMDKKKDSVDYNIRLDIVDSLETSDSIWRKKHLKSLNIILDEIYDGNDKSFIENKIFSFFIHYPQEFIQHLNNEGFDNIETWMLILNQGVRSATTPEDITLNSVANAAISNCKNCNEEQQRLIVDFIHKLEYSQQP